MKRGYLLPDGCKDLIDVMKKLKHQAKRPLIMFPLLPVGMLKKPNKATIEQLVHFGVAAFGPH